MHTIPEILKSLPTKTNDLVQPFSFLEICRNVDGIASHGFAMKCCEKHLEVETPFTKNSASTLNLKLLLCKVSNPRQNWDHACKVCQAIRGLTLEIGPFERMSCS